MTLALAVSVWLAVGPLLALTETELTRLFPRSPASVAARLVADLNGDGQAETAVAYELDTFPPYRIAVVQQPPGGRPRLLPGTLKLPLTEVALQLEARDLTGEGQPELIVRGGLGAHGSAWQAFALRGTQLVTLLSLSDAAPTEPMEEDVDGDGDREVIAMGGDHYVWAYACGLTNWQLTPHRYDGSRFVAAEWQQPATAAAQYLTRRLEREAAGRLWARALATAQEALAAEPSAITRWNLWLTRRLDELFAAQHESHQSGEGAEAGVLAATAAVLAGDHAAAARRLLSYRRVEDLPEGWTIPFETIRPVVAAAVEAAPDLSDAPATLVVHAFGLLAAGDQAAARSAFARARKAWPEPGALAPWAVVGLGGARLYFLGPDDLLRQADITADGRLLEPPRVVRQLGKLRSVAASPKRLGLAYVPAAGDQVVYRSAEGSSRPIRRGEFLYLTPHAIAPDGRTIAVDSGTSVIRKLTLVDLSTAQERGSLTYAGAFLWAPDGQAVVVESAAPAEPPLPWEDGGTRNLTLHRLQPKQVARLAVGDAGSVWSLLRWDHPSRLEALLTRYQRTPDGDAQPLSETRFGLDPATGQRQELGPDTRARSSHELLARRLPGGEYEPVGELSHSRFLLYRQHSGQATELWLMPHDGSREPVLLGPAPASTEPLVASWGALPE